MATSMTPPMAAHSDIPSLCSSFDDESYFLKTYVPLSNLPTPPSSSNSNSTTRHHSLEDIFSTGNILDPELLGPAIHLTNLIPISSSRAEPSIPLIQAILTRADLPIETVALAVCILDSLDSRFALSWRQGCPLNAPTEMPPSRKYRDRGEKQHIDSVHPELIVLSALILAVKFVDDLQQATVQYALDWGTSLWSCEQINFTQRALLENLGYRIMPLWDEGIILEALEDMERAAFMYSPELLDDAKREMDATLRAMSTGKAVRGIDGLQLTPALTPTSGNIKGTAGLPLETRKAFYGASLISEKEDRCLPFGDSTGLQEPPQVHLATMIKRGRHFML